MERKQDRIVRTIPHNIEAEQSVLGSVFLSKYALQKTILDNFPNFKVLTIRNNPFNYKRHEIIRSVKKHIRR